MHNRKTWPCLIGQCTIESTWRCFDWVMHNRSTWRCLLWLFKANHVIQDHEELCDALFGLLKIGIALASSISSWGAQSTYKERNTLFAVDPR